MTEIPWTVKAWASATGRQDGVPSYTRAALEEDRGRVPPLAIFRGGADGKTWSTLGGIRNASLHWAFKRYAAEHGHTIPDEVLEVWQAYEDSQTVAHMVNEAVEQALRVAVDEGERSPTNFWFVAEQAVHDLAVLSRA